MIVIINTNTDKSYHSKYKTKAAQFIGVHRNTVTRWINNGNKSEKYNHLKIYLHSEEI
jgi:transposase